jgi:predicted phage tail protein
MIRDVFLYGIAGRTFGRHFRLDVSSPAEALRALFCLRPALRDLIRRGAWRVIVGPAHLSNAVEAPCLGMQMGGQPMHLVPATRPRGDDGVGKIVAGVVLIGASILSAGAFVGFAAGFGAAMGTGIGFMGLTYGSIALLGVSMIFAGVAGMLSQPPKDEAATDKARPDDRPSFLFNGVTNNTQQGGPVPLVYGTHLVGSIVVSAGLNTEEVYY